KRLRLLDERERLRICRERRPPLSARKERRPHERNEPGQDTSRLTVPEPLVAIGLRSDVKGYRYCVICGRLFSHPCGNLPCSAFSRDLLHPSSCHLYLLCSLSRSEEHTSELQSPCNLVC